MESQTSKRITTSAIPMMNLQDFRKLSAELRKQWSSQNAEQPFFISNRLSNDMQIQDFSLKTQQGLHIKRQKKSRKSRMAKVDPSNSSMSHQQSNQCNNNDSDDDHTDDMNEDSDEDSQEDQQHNQQHNQQNNQQHNQSPSEPILPKLAPITNLPHAAELLNAVTMPVPKLLPKLSKVNKKIKN